MAVSFPGYKSPKTPVEADEELPRPSTNPDDGNATRAGAKLFKAKCVLELSHQPA